MGVVTVVQPQNRDAAGKDQLQRTLEEGKILFFPEPPFPIPEDDRAFLLRQRLAGASYHKNIAYKPGPDKVTGFAPQERGDGDRLLAILRGYKETVVAFLAELFPRYARVWKLEYGSFRPQEEEGREMALRKRNDLMHVDAFPTRPTRGDRILRFFTNINREKPRRWLTGTETFDQIAPVLAVSSGLLEKARRPGPGDRWRAAAAKAGFRVQNRSAYDRFMLGFHHFLKENEEYQKNAIKEFPVFPAGSSWMVYTDMVSHAVLSGQFALEQTFLIPREAMLLPEKAPISVLEKIAGVPLA